MNAKEKDRSGKTTRVASYAPHTQEMPNENSHTPMGKSRRRENGGNKHTPKQTNASLWKGKGILNALKDVGVQGRRSRLGREMRSKAGDKKKTDTQKGGGDTSHASKVVVMRRGKGVFEGYNCTPVRCLDGELGLASEWEWVVLVVGRDEWRQSERENESVRHRREPNNTTKREREPNSTGSD